MLDTIITFRTSSFILFEIFVFCIFGVVAVVLAYYENSTQEVLKKYTNITLRYIVKNTLYIAKHIFRYTKKLFR